MTSEDSSNAQIVPSPADVKKLLSHPWLSNETARQKFLTDIRDAVTLLCPEINTSADAFAATQVLYARQAGDKTELSPEIFLQARQYFLQHALSSLPSLESGDKRAATGRALLLINVLLELSQHTQGTVGVLEYPTPDRWVTYTPKGKLAKEGKAHHTKDHNEMCFSAWQTVPLPEAERFKLTSPQAEILSHANATLQALKPLLAAAVTEHANENDKQRLIEAAKRVMTKLNTGHQLQLGAGSAPLPGH